MDVEVVENAVPAEDDNNDSLPKCCPLCKNGFDKIVPKLLPCLHSFCQPCLEKRLNEQQRDQSQSSSEISNHGSASAKLKCPKCGQEFIVSSRGISNLLIDNQFILETVAKTNGESETEVHVCTSCEDNSSSTSYCLNCTEWLCNACVQAHQRVRVTKDHEIKSREELKISLKGHGRSERSLFCQKHPSEKLKLFCATCERLTCRDCQLLEHKDHKYQFVNEAASRYREFFKKRLEILGEKVGPLAESIEAVQNSAKHLDHKADMVASEIKNSSAEIVKAVKTRENSLLNELKALVHFKRKMLTKQSKDLHLMQEILNHNYEFAKYAVLQGSDVSLLYSKRELGSRIQNLLSLKYRVTPVAHSDLKFATEAVKLCNLISKAGTVMTPSSQRSSASPGTIPHRNSNMMVHSQNGPHSGIKVGPLHSPNAFSNRHGSIAGASPMIASSNHKPSSKVYPNVISSQVSMSLLSNGSRPSSMPFLNSNEVRNPQVRVLPRPMNPTSSSLSAGINTTTSFHSGGPSRRMVSQSDGSAIPLHHLESAGKNHVRASPPRYDKSVAGPRNLLSSSVTPDNISSQTSHHGNGFSSGPRETRRDSSSSNTGVDQAIRVVSPSKISQNSPKPPQLSPSPVSPGLRKLSPNHSQTSPSPHVSPVPQVSPRSFRVSSSPAPASPLPSFLDKEMQEVLSGGVKVKVEKDASPPGRVSACSEVKKEESKQYSSCGLASERSLRDDLSFGPPSDNSSNDDWCAVCHNGGELLCCDTCPKVFHLQCHVPSLTTTPSDTWSCGLCESLDRPPSKTGDGASGSHKRRAPIGGMSERDTKICEKILLDLFCHADSLPFHDKVSKAVPNYYRIIQRPMDLTSIKTKLQPMHFEHYNNINEFIADCKLIFSNCALFNEADSEVGKMGRRLAVDFQEIVRKYRRHDNSDDEPKTKRRKEDSL